MANTTADKLEYLGETKTAIKNALIEKGAPVNDETVFRAYASKIAALKSGTINTVDVISAEGNLEAYSRDDALGLSIDERNVSARVVGGDIVIEIQANVSNGNVGASTFAQAVLSIGIV